MNNETDTTTTITQTNIPLTPDQKVTILSLRNRLLTLKVKKELILREGQHAIHKIETAEREVTRRLQSELNRLAVTNSIDAGTFGLNDECSIVPTERLGTPRNSEGNSHEVLR